MAEDSTRSVGTEAQLGKSEGKKRRHKRGTKTVGGATKRGMPLEYPKHPILKCLRIPQAVLENNAGKDCTDREAAKFAGGAARPQLKSVRPSSTDCSNVRHPGRSSPPTSLAAL